MFQGDAQQKSSRNFDSNCINNMSSTIAVVENETFIPLWHSLDPPDNGDTILVLSSILKTTLTKTRLMYAACRCGVVPILPKVHLL